MAPPTAEQLKVTQYPNPDQAHKHMLGFTYMFLVIYLFCYFWIQKLLSSLGGSFLYYADHFKLYSGFCANHIKVQKVLERGKRHYRTSYSLCGFNYTYTSRTVRGGEMPALGFIGFPVVFL